MIVKRNFLWELKNIRLSKFTSFIFIFVLVFSIYLPVVHLKCEETGKIDALTTYREGNDRIIVSSELPFFAARQDSLGGLIKGKDNYFMLLCEIKARINFDINETEDDREDYSDISRYAVNEIENVEITVGGEEDTFHVIVAYKLTHSEVIITFIHSTFTQRASIDVVFRYLNYNKQKYDTGFGYMLNGAYFEIIGSNETPMISIHL